MHPEGTDQAFIELLIVASKEGHDVPDSIIETESYNALNAWMRGAGR